MSTKIKPQKNLLHEVTNNTTDSQAHLVYLDVIAHSYRTYQDKTGRHRISLLKRSKNSENWSLPPLKSFILTVGPLQWYAVLVVDVGRSCVLFHFKVAILWSSSPNRIGSMFPSELI